MALDRELIALRVARALRESGARYVNLGIGIPTLVSNFIPDFADVILQSENGMLNYGPLAEPGEEDLDLRNAGGQFVTLLPGASIFDSAASFALIRGGRLDATVLGGLQVSEAGDLANWMRPDRGIGSMGGAMDLVTGAKQVIVAMEHTTRQGHPKIVRNCSYPLTGRRCVSLIVTDLAVVEVTPTGLLLREVAPGHSVEDIQARTEPRLLVAEDVGEITF
ncbi:MAG: 3-oxoacid CoA-transferase subunit B [Dehalococcoidia bacterium]